jgi:hypothetical protein
LRCSVLQFLWLIGAYNVGHFKTHCNELLTSLMSHSIISSSNSNSQKGKMWNKPRLFQVPRTSFTQSPAFGCEGAIHITAMSSGFTTHITCHIHTITMWRQVLGMLSSFLYVTNYYSTDHPHLQMGNIILM